ncbi:protein-methionine sulfoxide oxidase mical3a-like isoform X2 [Corticium candelabrum]|uniref:protein-methionine sulfoxide oxidase mical3a-like isoform X2 n=1 Tax=Corticium candelabrum TaxID=121492 RepID=UPI002E2618BF|nr:protein-methionine sulfoxide oxidase mical3a-like isoform X2 [Corticium candelabrum]
MNVADGNSLYDRFVESKTLKDTIDTFSQLCTALDIDSTQCGLTVYHQLKEKLRSWKCSSLWSLLDKRAAQKEYGKGRACIGKRILIIGGGPAGLRVAVEGAFLGCDVHVVEKRNVFTRNNVLHLWPFTIEDLKSLGTKKFFGKFCSGAIDHINIRTLQLILLKISLILGAKMHTGVEFVEVVPPTSSHPAEGAKPGLPGFTRKEFRGKLALGITANFVNRNTREEAAVSEISGVAFIFNQSFFQELKESTGINLENIVYYKDETHYFVMTAKKESLFNKGVFKQNLSDVSDLLSKSNLDFEALCSYAREAADFSTDLPHLDFELNHKGQPDVAIFDFTSLFAADHAANVWEVCGQQLLVMMVGDALIEPFWPTGSGCGRAFLSAMDAAWTMKCFSQGMAPLELLALRERVFQFLPQTTPDRLNQQFNCYTINPSTRYPDVMRKTDVAGVTHLYLKDEQLSQLSLQVGDIAEIRKKVRIDQESTAVLERQVHKELPPNEDKITPLKTPRKTSYQQRRGITRAIWSPAEDSATVADTKSLISWSSNELRSYKLSVTNMTTSWSDGKAFCCLIHRYFPHLIDFDSVKKSSAEVNNKLAFDIAEKHLGISALLNPEDMNNPDKLTVILYVSRLFDYLHDKEPVLAPGISQRLETPIDHEKQRKKPSDEKQECEVAAQFSVARQNLRKVKRQMTRSSSGKWDFTNRDLVYEATTAIASPSQLVTATPTSGSPQFQPKKRSSLSDRCHFCTKRVYAMEKFHAEGFFFHRGCFRCSHCNCQLKLGDYAYSKGEEGQEGKFFCRAHFKQLFYSNPAAVGYARAEDKAKRTSEMPPANQPELHKQSSVFLKQRGQRYANPTVTAAEGSRETTPTPVDMQEVRQVGGITRHRLSLVEIARKSPDEQLRETRLAQQRLAQKQHRKRLRLAQEIQREMGMLEVQLSDLEQKGVFVEEKLRQDNLSESEESALYGDWYSLINEKNALVRRDAELMILFKDLQLEDKRQQIENELRAREAIPAEEKTEEDRKEEKQLLQDLLAVVDERDELVNQTEEERVRELEEDQAIQNTLTKKGLWEAEQCGAGCQATPQPDDATLRADVQTRDTSTQIRDKDRKSRFFSWLF